jgi:hypothetical protein
MKSPRAPRHGGRISLGRGRRRRIDDAFADLAAATAGTGGGVFKTGQALNLAGGSNETSLKALSGKNMQDVHLTILNQVFGGTQKEFGVSVGNVPSQGVLTELLA